MKRICVVTGTRAEYGLLSNIMLEINNSEKLKLQIIATGTHLSPEFGLTYKEIENDGFHIDEKVDMLLSSDTKVAVAKSMGLAVLGFATAFEKLKPDMIMILGDRYEILSAAQTALVMQIPIAHISGGEITEGAIDDSIRHAVTKLSSVHFPANEEYKNRIVQLGENPNLVFNVGDPGVENIRKINFLSKKELEDYFGFKLNKFFLVTFHPVTTEKDSIKQIKELFLALDSYPEYKVIFTKTNADSEGRKINKLIESYVKTHSERVVVYNSLGQLKYLSTLKYASAVIGNSSSGIVEAPAMNIPTVNIGNRQKGRLRAHTIIDCLPDYVSIKEGIDQAVNLNSNLIEKNDLKYDGINTSTDIINIIEKLDFKNLINKKFFDL